MKGDGKVKEVAACGVPQSASSGVTLEKWAGAVQGKAVGISTFVCCMSSDPW